MAEKTIGSIVAMMRQRAAGFEARGDTIFNGMIVGHELRTWAEELSFLPASEPGEVEKLRERVAILEAEIRVMRKLPDAIRSAMDAQTNG